MGKPSIIDKLKRHLKEDQMPLTEECQVMYLMAEIRKVLEHDNSSDKYPALRFYSNWCVHTRLDRPNKFMRRAAAEIESEIQACIEAKQEVLAGQNLTHFLSMQELRKALGDFLTDNNIPQKITEEKNWKHFKSLLVEIISEQPIEAPSERIAEFVYDDFGNGFIYFQIEPPKFRRFKFSQ
jgi:hypothetical protein